MSIYSLAKGSWHLPNISEKSCIILIGMAGAGKTTVGRLIAKALDWAFADSDHIIEATFGASLQRITDAMSKDAFIDLEAEIVQQLRLSRTVLATGGSVIYRKTTMDFLKHCGPIVYLDVPMQDILARIARNPERGLAIAPGQTVEELFQEREQLYRRYASLSVHTSGITPAESANYVLEKLAAYNQHKPRGCFSYDS